MKSVVYMLNKSLIYTADGSERTKSIEYSGPKFKNAPDKFAQTPLCVHIIFPHTCVRTIAKVLNQDVSMTVYAT